MEISENTLIATESFSCSWLVNVNPSVESLDASFRFSFLDALADASFVDIDSTISRSKSLFRTTFHQDLKFDFPISDPNSNSVAHADQLFSNGYIMPVYLDSMHRKAFKDDTPDSCLGVTVSSNADDKLTAASNKTYRKSLKKMVEKYLDFLWPLLRRVRLLMPRSSVAKSRIYLLELRAQVNAGYSINDRRESCDSDDSIYEAVLHCKRSIGMQTM